MGSFLHKSFRQTLVLIIALLLIVYSRKAQNVEGTGQQKPLKITGVLAANLMFIDAQVRPSNGEKFSWSNTVNLTVETYGTTPPFLFTLSEQQCDFSRPFNRVGVVPHYNGVKDHTRYRNFVFSPLGGQPMAVSEATLTPDKYPSHLCLESSLKLCNFCLTRRDDLFIAMIQPCYHLGYKYSTQKEGSIMITVL